MLANISKMFRFAACLIKLLYAVLPEKLQAYVSVAAVLHQGTLIGQF
jgi:hypothetical protein